MSLPTVDSWVRRGMPCLKRGQRGVEWEFDLLAVVLWRYKVTAAEEPEADPDKMSPKERLDHYRAEREKTKHHEECGSLMRAADFERALSDALKTVAVTLESLPDVLERDAGIDGAAVEVAQAVVDRIRGDLYQRLTGNG